MVEDVGLEPLFLLPKQACYHYTTSSVWWSRGDLHPCPKSLHEQDLLTQYTVSQCSPYGGNYATVKRQPRAYNGLHTSTTLFLSTVTRKTAMAGCFFNLRRLPISSWCVVLESSHQSGSSPLSHKSSKSGVDHYNRFSVVISFLGMPLGGHLPVSLALSKPRRI